MDGDESGRGIWPTASNGERIGVVWHGSFFLHRRLAVVNRGLTLALVDRGSFEISIRHDRSPAFDPWADYRSERVGLGSPRRWRAARPPW